MSETTRRFFRSTGAATFSQIWRVGVTFAITLLLRRLIAPGDYGLFDWALSVFLVLGALRDLGLVYHVVRVPSRPYGNLLAVQLGWGLLLAAAAFFGAPLLAQGLTQPHPEVVPVLRTFSLFLFFEGLASVPRVYFDAELQVGRTVVPEIVRNLAFAVTSLTLAWLGYGIWSLVVAHVLCTGLYAAHLWMRARGHIPLRYERGNTLRLIGQSLPLAAIWVLAIFNQRVDTLILGLRFDAGQIGHYYFAYTTAFLVTVTLVPAVTRTLYPALVAYRDEPWQLMEAYRLATLFVLTLEAPVAAFLFVNPETSIRILGGEQWVLAPGYLRILALTPLIDPFSRLGGEILKTFHQDRIWIVSFVATLVSFVAFGWTLTGSLGPAGMAWANYLPLGGLVMAWAVRRLAPGPFRQLARDIAVVYAVPVLPFAAAWAIGGDRLWLRFGASLLALAAALAVYGWRFGGAFRRFFSGPEPAQGA